MQAKKLIFPYNPINFFFKNNESSAFYLLLNIPELNLINFPNSIEIIKYILDIKPN